MRLPVARRDPLRSAALRFVIRLIRSFADARDWEAVQIVIDESKVQEDLSEREAQCLSEWAQRRAEQVA